MKFKELQCLTYSICLKWLLKSLFLIYFLLQSFYYFLHNVMFRKLFSTFVEQPSISQDFLCNPPNQSILVALSDPSLSWLTLAAPCFPVKGEKVTVIKEPGKFYETLVEKSAIARNRIIFASLYLGTGKLESSLVQTIQKNLQQNKFLKVDILLDFARGTRGESSSKSMLLPLIQEFKNFTLSMYHTPDLRGITKKIAPARWNELLGLQHMKVYLFDDSVMISGANLSNDYFTNRQDRYILIEDKSLADFYAKFIGKVQQFSMAIQSDSEAVLHKDWEVLPYEGYKHDFTSKARSNIVEFFNETMTTQREAIENQLNNGADTWIFPLVEMGQIGIHHDSVVTKKLLQSPLNGSELKLATGYFNLTQDYMDILTSQCLAQCSLLMAHPNANGFQGAKGPAGGIPAAYTLIAKKFYEALVNAKQNQRFKFMEYQKTGWTYHAKGLWYYLPGSKNPNLTLIGSSNFGERSVNRDLETQICLVTTNESLKQRLQDEVASLYSLGSLAEQDILDRPVPKWVQAVVRIFRNFF